MISFIAEAEAAASQIVEAIVPMAALRLVGNLRNSKLTFFFATVALQLVLLSLEDHLSQRVTIDLEEVVPWGFGDVDGEGRM